MTKQLDYYKILRIEYGADKADIVAAYRKLCKIYHPDISRNPGSEEIMKQINNAYAVLSNDAKREAYYRSYAASKPRKQNQYGNTAASRETQTWNSRRGRTYGETYGQRRAKAKKAEEKAFLSVQDYLSCLLTHNYQRAYELLSDRDKDYVTQKAFTDWREAVNRHYIMREFQINGYEAVLANSIRAGMRGQIWKYNTDLVELNLKNQVLESRNGACYLIPENGKWRVLLDAGELTEIARVIQELSPYHQKSEMEKYWEQYCEDNCRQLGLLSLSGFIKKAGSELYGYSRYKQSLILVSFAVKPLSSGWPDRVKLDILKTLSETLKSSIRSSDIPAYLGNGVFIVLFSQLKKRRARSITDRLIEKMTIKVYEELKVRIDVQSTSLEYKGGYLRQYIDFILDSIENKA